MPNSSCSQFGQTNMAASVQQLSTNHTGPIFIAMADTTIKSKPASTSPKSPKEQKKSYIF
jgi:hypothetical protein